MKNDYEYGGLKIPDIECLDRALKLKQYIRANKSNHIIKMIQIYCSKNGGLGNTLAQEFKNIMVEEEICKIAQETLNIIVDYTREEMFGEMNQNEVSSIIAINQIAATNVETYLKRKERVFLSCMLKPFLNEGLESYHDFVMEAETEALGNRSKRLETIMNAFPKYYRNAANSFNKNTNEVNENITHFLKINLEWVPITEITTKDLQWILKKALNLITEADFQNRLNLENNTIDPVQFRNDC